MPLLMRVSSFAALCALTCSASATPIDVAKPSAKPVAVHAHVDASMIRTHKLQHFQSKLETPSVVSKALCRFESDISTVPPHKQVALTFDDGPEPGQTELILAVLAKYKIHAAFFMIGEKAKLHPELVAKVHDAGHLIIGNHSWSHPNFHDITVAQQTIEVNKTDAALEQAMGKPKFFRYPYGNSTCATNALVRSQGYKIVGWHVDSCDWAFDKTGKVDVKEAATCGVLAQNRDNFVEHVASSVRAHNGGIILMHEIHPNTVRQLDTVVNKILEGGFQFGMIDDPAFATSLR